MSIKSIEGFAFFFRNCLKIVIKNILTLYIFFTQQLHSENTVSCFKVRILNQLIFNVNNV